MPTSPLPDLMVGRCGVGIARLTSNQTVANPRSLAFGGARISLGD